MKCLRSLLFALLFALALPTCADGQSVQFLVTGDLHGQLKNLSRLAVHFQEYPDAVKIDLGDIFQLPVQIAGNEKLHTLPIGADGQH